MIKHITSLGIAPLVTLYHWTVPLWFRDKGGWLNDGAVRAFTRFATKMAECLGGYVTHWITLNEPEIYAANSYLTGVWPPQQRNLIHFLRVFHRLIYAHRAAYHAIKRLQPTALIGIAKNNIYFEAAGHNPVNHILKALCDYGWNRYFLNRIKHHQDFIGLNYYFHNRMDWGRVKNKNERTSDLGWELYPQGIYDVLTELKAYHLPIYITENGLADAADLERGWFITETLRQVHRAIEQGVDVRGYLHWSLLDNFEWDKGFYPRFGLIAVDYATQKRTPRPSALLFASIAKNNRLEFDHL
jgi:beta-glucosidase